MKKQKRTMQRYYTKEDIFLSRVASILKMPKGAVLSLFCQRAISTIRINTLAGDKNKILNILQHKDLFLKPIPWMENSYFVLNYDKNQLAQLNEYQRGLFYIQNLSSMIPALVLEPQINEKILDICAAPGSKTTQLADMMHNTGIIIANDEDAWRAQKLIEVLKLFHVKNTDVTIGHGEDLHKRYPNYFDKVLLDAPCSGEGQIYMKSENSLRFWNIKKVKAMSQVQLKLIDSAFKSLKAGGVLVYSTCTLEPQEDESVVSKLLEKFPNASIEPIDFITKMEFKDYRKHIKSGLTEWDQYKYNPQVINCIRVYPSSEMMGFFVAKIKKR